PAEQFTAEADREGVRLHPEPAADEIVAELVDEDQRPDDGEKGQDREKEGRTAQAWIFPVSAAATLRASPSISSTASMDVGAGGSKRASTSPTREAISRKPSRLSRKEATAISLAALRIAGLAPPAARASRARRSAGKRSRSGASKARAPIATR